MRLLDMGVPPYMVATRCSLVLAQRLVRVICDFVQGRSRGRRPRTRMAGRRRRRRRRAGQGLPGAPAARPATRAATAGEPAVYEMVEMTPELVRSGQQRRPGRLQRGGGACIGRAYVAARMRCNSSLTGRTTRRRSDARRRCRLRSGTCRNSPGTAATPRNCRAAACSNRARDSRSPTRSAARASCRSSSNCISRRPMRARCWRGSSGASASATSSCCSSAPDAHAAARRRADPARAAGLARVVDARRPG